MKYVGGKVLADLVSHYPLQPLGTGLGSDKNCSLWSAASLRCETDGSAAPGQLAVERDGHAQTLGQG